MHQHEFTTYVQEGLGEGSKMEGPCSLPAMLHLRPVLHHYEPYALIYERRKETGADRP